MCLPPCDAPCLDLAGGGPFEMPPTGLSLFQNYPSRTITVSIP